jgi:hypothetical protein
MAKRVPYFSGEMLVVADLIRGSATQHEATHLDDLETALRG